MTSVVTQFPLFERYPALERSLPRVPLSSGPSPVRLLEAVSREAGAEVWVKNDGVYGSLYGGNKPRKLEFLLPGALERGVKTVMTTGPLGTHHGLATAIYGQKLGLRVVLLLTYQQPNKHVVRQLCRMDRAGAEMHYFKTGAGMVLAIPRLTASCAIRDRGRLPYLFPPGGSTPLGSLGYVNAAFELAAQVAAGDLPEPAVIVLPVASGGTAAGLALGLGLAGLSTEVVGIAVTRAPTSWSLVVRRLASETARLMRRHGAEIREPRAAPIRCEDAWLGPGYGRPSRASEGARRLLIEREGLRLEPTYTAKTVAGLIALAANGRLPGPVLYWHTYDALLPPDETFGPADYKRLPKPFRRFCPSSGV